MPILWLMLYSLCSFKVFRKNSSVLLKMFMAEQVIKVFFVNTGQIHESCLQR